MLKVPLRDVDAGLRENGCGARFAIVMVDFEPAAAFELVDATHPTRSRQEWADGRADARSHPPGGEDLRAYKNAFADAMRRELGRVAVKVILTRLRYHEVDSSERAFVLAARRAARELYRRVPCRLSRPVRGVRVRDAGVYHRGARYAAGITVDFEPADEYAFVSTVDSRRVPKDHVATVREVFHEEAGGQPVRIVLTGEEHDNVLAFRFRDVTHQAVSELRAHLRPAE
ncbi:hypothetical protein [Spirillospora sp. NBC_01491]|uniref:hypothetical protein n=1 Tax=Spirillospora sp. NBC_01491 TaxID=2976007 RepID=UPI002E31A426|nr:hypothetical protein [Spirillospora sp. NBC_01491]